MQLILCEEEICSGSADPHSLTELWRSVEVVSNDLTVTDHSTVNEPL